VTNLVGEFEGYPVYMSTWNFGDKFKDKFCPVCNGKIIAGNVIPLFSNGRLFPNILLHEHCYDIENPRSTVWSVIKSYQEYKTIQNEHRAWKEERQ
jgi:hypothetical protein